MTDSYIRPDDKPAAADNSHGAEWGAPKAAPSNAMGANVIQKNWQELIRPNKLQVSLGSDPKRQATLIAEPLERGFGVTLGNALRRILLSSLQAQHKAAIDISPLALKKTSQRVSADCAVAIAERLPYPAEMFDVVVSVGVMEHFLNDGEATREIHRVLKRGGSYLALIHTQAYPSGMVALHYKVLAAEGSGP
jgi:SAM-dependent methyltransferase